MLFTSWSDPSRTSRAAFLTVLVLVLLPPLGGWLGGGSGADLDAAQLWRTLGWTLLQVGGFVALMLLVGHWNESREEASEVSKMSIPWGFASLLEPYRFIPV